MSDDVLQPLTLTDVAAFYGRVADAVDRKKGTLSTSLAADFMRQWLRNRDASSTYRFDAPEHLKTHPDVMSELRYHRKVFLTQEEARFTGGSKRRAGVVPRLQGKPPYQPWDPSRPLTLEYESLVEMSLRYQLTGNDGDRDLLYALRGFQLKSTVSLVGEQDKKDASRYLIKFLSYQAEVFDRYDWNYDEYFTVPNPDFGSAARQGVVLVQPSRDAVRIYHRNAKRLEDANLAKPYDVRSNAWSVIDPQLLAAEWVVAR